MGKLKVKHGVKRKSAEKETGKHFSRWRLGVFQKKVNDVTVGYYVGWRYYCYIGTPDRKAARNIREGLFFDTPEAAIAFRDSIENGRRDIIATDTQIA